MCTGRVTVGRASPQRSSGASDLHAYLVDRAWDAYQHERGTRTD
jgi:hypothetical protein